jgi:hypothetical protein
MSETPPIKSEEDVFESEAVKLLNYMIDRKAQELIMWGNILKSQATENETSKYPDTVGVRTYNEGKRGHGPEKNVPIPVSKHQAEKMLVTCQKIIALETEINELQRTKLRAARDYDFDDGGALQEALWGETKTSVES